MWFVNKLILQIWHSCVDRISSGRGSLFTLATATNSSTNAAADANNDNDVAVDNTVDDNVDDTVDDTVNELLLWLWSHPL